MAQRIPFRLFDVAVRERIVLSPSMLRIVFAGPALAQARSGGPDQRIKIFFPTASGALDVPSGEDWYSRYRSQPEAERSPMRTYTVRALRVDAAGGEMDVDFAVHGDSGPASRWALRAGPGDRVRLLAPHAQDQGAGGVEWQPPADVREVLLIADETALPAVAGILETLAAQPRPPKVRAFIEVPLPADALPLLGPDDAQIVWLPRARPGQPPAEHGQRLVEAIRAAALSPQAMAAPASAHAAAQASAAEPRGPRGQADHYDGAQDELAEIDVDRDILWEQAAAAASGFYAWIAGEAGAVMAIRRHLVGERGFCRSAISFMGYWRKGRVLD